MTIGEKIYKIRTSNELSQKDFAKLINASQTSVNFWESGKRQPKIEQLKKISEVFSIPQSYLLDWEESKKQPGVYIDNVRVSPSSLHSMVDQILVRNPENTHKDKTLTENYVKPEITLVNPDCACDTKKDIEKILDQTREQLLSQEGLMFDGEPASPEAIESILAAMQIGMEMAKKKNKEKYTPKNKRK